MRRNRLIPIAAILLLSTLNHQLSTCFAQGSLAPPGAPAPTMKSLAQIEPRTPISSAPFTISTPGSYYLTTNLNVTSGDAIDIATNGVTLNLNGFTISSTETSPTGTGIMLAGGNTDITILNGHIEGGVTNNAGVFSGSGFASGIRFYPGSVVPSNVRVSSVSVSGCQYYGILLDKISNPLMQSSIVESCTVQTIGSFGILAGSVTRCMAYQCGGSGIWADTASDCVSHLGELLAITANNCYGDSDFIGMQALNANNCYGIGVNTGLYASTAQNCYGQSSSGDGIDTTTAQNCYGISSGGGYGIRAQQSASGCYGFSSSGIGLNATTANNCTAGSNSGLGLYAVRTAIGCDGESGSGTGLYVWTGVAFGCFGYSSTGLGLQAYVATGCYGQNGGGTSETIGFKYNMP